MLTSLAVQNVVLIEKLSLSFAPGLTVLTGETGAGKSILLDALGLALGARADSGLVRAGAQQASVTAEFQLPHSHPVLDFLEAQDIAIEETLILRRTLSSDGRSRAFANDQQISVGLLRQLGEVLVEIEGQFEAQGLLDGATHRLHLDLYGGLEAQAAATAEHYKLWRAAEAQLANLRETLARAAADEAYLRHSVTELELAAPTPGEETALVTERTLLSHRAQLTEAINAAASELGGEKGAQRALLAAQRRLDRLGDKAGEQTAPILDAIERTSVELSEAISGLERLTTALDADPGKLERIEERLYLLRNLARKHHVAVEGLPDLLEEMRTRLDAMDNGASDLGKLEAVARETRAAYIGRAETLSKARKKAAKAMDQAVNGELPPLKLDKARFATRIETLPETQWSEHGQDRVTFEVATNPGASPGPIDKIASGGELARFMLALKVTLAAHQPVPTLVFDEVDAGIGGATAAAVGARLKRLAERVQLLVITHSPQVAALGAQHWRVDKSAGAGSITTKLETLDGKARREEIARMLSGATVTEEARAQADRLLTGAA